MVLLGKVYFQAESESGVARAMIGDLGFLRSRGPKDNVLDKIPKKNSPRKEILPRASY